MEKIFEPDRIINNNKQNILGLFSSDYIDQTDQQFFEIPESMFNKLDRNRIQHSNAPLLQHSGIWNEGDKDGE
jgi:hypothetical protein